jgi:hypothetical protein
VAEKYTNLYMVVLPEHFDQENYWLLATRIHIVRTYSNSELWTKEYEWIWCSNVAKEVFWGGINPNNVNSPQWPGKSWKYADILETFSLEHHLLSINQKIDREIFAIMNFEWFRPILERLAAGDCVSYSEANEAFAKVHSGKPLRLYPFLAPLDAIDEWLMMQDHEY